MRGVPGIVFGALKASDLFSSSMQANAKASRAGIVLSLHNMRFLS